MAGTCCVGGTLIRPSGTFSHARAREKATFIKCLLPSAGWEKVPKGDEGSYFRVPRANSPPTNNLTYSRLTIIQKHHTATSRRRRNDMSKLSKFEKGSGNIFADLGLENADELLLKAGIVSETARLMKQKKLTQAKAATLTGTAQPDLSNLLRGKFRGFSIERLMLMLTAFGRDVDVVVRPAPRSRKQGGIGFKRAAA